MATESGIPTSSTKPVSSQNRKSSKPIMEKRRRARINASLSELKALLLEVMKKEGTRHHKMEKADILEMTVKHLRTIQRQQFTASAVHEPSVVTKYHSGFSECASEVTRYLSNVEGVDVELRARVLNHLANSLQNVGSQAPSVSPSPSAVSTFTRPETCGGSSSPVHIAPKGSISPDINNNTMSVIQTVQQPSLASHTPLTVNTSLTAVTSSDANMQAKMMSGLQVIPTKLQNGEIAFVLSGSNVPCVIPIYAGTNQQQQTVVSPGVQSPMQSPASLPPQSPIVVTPTSPSSTSSLKSPNSIASLCSPNRTTPPPQVLSYSGLQEDDNTPQDLSYSSSRSGHQSQEDMDTDSSDNNTPKNSDNLSNQKVVNMNQIVQPFSSDMWRPW